MVVTLVIVSLGAVLILYSLINGLVISLLWGWFMVPVFQLPALSIPAAIGVSLMVSYLTFEGGKPDEGLAPLVGRLIAKPVIGLALGWIVHLFL